MSDQSTSLFESLRPRLFGLAYRMLGEVSTAEDILQEAWIRWDGADKSAISKPENYILRIVSNLCLDRLKSAREQRRAYTGPWLPEPLITDTKHNPERRTERSERLSMAFLTLLDTLTPQRRAVYILREIFDYPYADIAGMLHTSQANCRKITQRARRQLEESDFQESPSTDHHRELLDAFLDAAYEGDTRRLEQMLTDGSELYSDGGGNVTAARKPIRGADAIAKFMAGIARKAPGAITISHKGVNERPGIVARIDGQVQSVWSFETDGAQVKYCYIVLNPEKLKHMGRTKSI